MNRQELQVMNYRNPRRRRRNRRLEVTAVMKTSAKWRFGVTTRLQGPQPPRVDRIVKMRKTRKGETEYLVHWKGCGSNDDTWEKESNLNCKKLIDEFLKNQVQDNTKDDKEKKKQTEKKKKDEVEEKKEEKNKDDGEEESSDSSCDGNEYEVEDIVDAKTEYLVKWKGWPSKYNSWVDEKDIYCENLIEDFLKNRKGASS
ncbi:chromobox protein homolog 3-like isoform X2 [Nilaparvata lugens]|uniref:chromobox protein homolog 3-like isoform X2 n=1 Tax=Nilaparvata lugens TaxID=108931 RepID=UPI00193D7D38|nr:chromobox protein homolog 3-like isoform X2 [Nilaparvata lugens]XP_039284582.1 chromobox protein homolog 3-like isoform X2 [Nilaparvata lugens]